MDLICFEYVYCSHKHVDYYEHQILNIMSAKARIKINNFEICIYPKKIYLIRFRHIYCPHKQVDYYEHQMLKIMSAKARIEIYNFEKLRNLNFFSKFVKFGTLSTHLIFFLFQSVLLLSILMNFEKKRCKV